MSLRHVQENTVGFLFLLCLTAINATFHPGGVSRTENPSL